ncbi:MAG: glycosyltransferase family 2 protein [Terriglobales bacterium]
MASGPQVAPVRTQITPSGQAVGADAGEAIELSVVIPCLNEARTIADCIRQVQQTFASCQIAGEIIVADNSSTDGSQEMAAAAGARVVPVERKGYGAALMGGIDAARGRFIIMGDGDSSYDFTHIPRFLEQLRSGNGLVMGNRFRGGIESGAMPFLNRHLGNPLLTAIGRMLFKVEARDFHCGLRGFSKEAYDRLQLRTTGMEFASEMVVKASLYRVQVAEVPTTLSPDRRGRPPHLRPWRDGWRHLRFMLLYSPRWLFLYPGLLLILAGSVAGLWLLPHSRQMAGITFDVHTMVYAGMAVIMGFQAVAFAVFSKVFAITEGLLPPDPKLDRLFRHITLEVGLVLGVTLMLAGSAVAVWAVGYWGEHGFGPLDLHRTLRLVIFSATTLTLGVQTIFSSFFLSVLGLSRR